MNTSAWILMLSVQVPVVLLTAYLFYRVMHSDDKDSKD